eukprot:EG_transcript_16030
MKGSWTPPLLMMFCLSLVFVIINWSGRDSEKQNVSFTESLMAHQPQNSSSFQVLVSALHLVHAVDLDVQATQDNQILVYHSRRLEDGTTGHGHVYEHPAHHLLALRYRGTSAPLTLLDPLLPVIAEHPFPGTVPGPLVGIDLKVYHACAIRVGDTAGCDDTLVAIAEKLLRLVHRHQLQDRVALFCRHPVVARVFHSDQSIISSGIVYPTMSPPEIETVINDPRYKVIYFERHTLLEGITGLQYVQQCRARGKHVWAWVVDNATEADRLHRMGVTRIITNRYAEWVR